MKTFNEDAWIMRMAELEDSAFVSAGEHFCPPDNSTRAGALSKIERSAFSKFLELARRERRLTMEQFAGKARIPLEELVCMEDEESYLPRPRTIHSLASYLNVSEMKLLALAGLAQSKDLGFRSATVRFAAKSESTRRLSSEEHEALEEFVRFLSEQ